jgi:hypothetical protein
MSIGEHVPCTHSAKDYDHCVIDCSQFVNGLWMGTILLFLGLVPGLLDRSINEISKTANALFLRLPPSAGVRLPSRGATHTPLRQPRWLAALGLAIIAGTIFAFVAR